MVTIEERAKTNKDYIRKHPNGRWQVWWRNSKKWVFDDESFEAGPAGEGKNDVILSYEATKNEDAEVE